MYLLLSSWREWAVDQQAYVFAANQFLHNLFLAWVAAVPWFLWWLRRERQRMEPEAGKDLDRYLDRVLDQQARWTFWILLFLMLTGANFGVLDLALFGKLRSIGIVPTCALGIKVGLAATSLTILFYLWRFLAPQIQALRVSSTGETAPHLGTLLRRRRQLWTVLIALGPIILAAAAVLRFTS